MEKTFIEFLRGFIGQRVSYNFGIDYSGSGKLIAVHADCVQFEYPAAGTGRGPARKGFVPIAHLHSVVEA